MVRNGSSLALHLAQKFAQQNILSNYVSPATARPPQVLKRAPHIAFFAAEKCASPAKNKSKQVFAQFLSTLQ
jgi:hypothetical protein